MMGILQVSVLAGLVMSIFSFFSFSSTLKDDETVIFFPVSATQDKQGNWLSPIHHWVFEKEENDLSRKITQGVFSEVFESLGVSEEQAKSPLTKQRLMWFLVDNQRRKKIEVLLIGKQYPLNLTAANGHAETNISINGKNLKAGEWLTYKAKDNYKRDFTGQVQLIPETGLSVISDIDDTIKVSNVLDKKELIKNTFTRPYQATKGFPAYFRQLQKAGAYFHYVSASPWQLHPSLQLFMEKNYPKGTVSLRKMRLKDSSIIQFLKPSTEYKIKAISNIISRYPKHQFILIGDSGEHDPEVYAEIYRKFPNHIQSIHIRAVTGSNLSESRFAETFKRVPATIWRIVRDYSKK